MAFHDKSWLNPGHGLRNLANDTSSTSRWRRNRSSANLLDQVAQSPPAPEAPASTKPTPKPTPKLERSASRMSLFNLFSKPKVEKARGHSEVGLAIPMQPQQPPKRPVSPSKSSLRQNPPPQAQQVQRMRSSQMLRPMSIRPSSTRRPPSNDHWDPPPLFQAYPQSVKYATVQACVFSPDVLLRTQSQRKQAELLRERMDSHRDLSATLEGIPEHRKLEKNHRRLISNSVLHSTPQLTNKVYVLVTSGYMLQYSGDGPFDRLPEKVLKLGKESAAFACDLIPGKHWVLQISQSANEDGTVSTGPKHSLLSRLRLQGHGARRAATSFLLVMESAEEMESWMTAVRKEIEHLGGMKTSHESSRPSSSTDETAETSSPIAPTHRYMVQRDTNRGGKMTPVDSPLQSQYSDSPKIVASDWEGDRSEKTVSVGDSVSVQSSRHSIMRRSVEAPSIATAISHDQVQLDQLRERSRYSYVSTATTASGTGTRNTSRNSSPAPTSPLKEGFSPADAEPLRSATSLRSFHMSPGNTTTRRRSMQPLPVTNEDGSISAHSPSTPQRHSIYGPTSPTSKEPGKLELDIPASTPAHATTPRPTNNVRFSTVGQPQTLKSATPARYGTRSSSAPPSRNATISPPPRDPAPTPPAVHPQSTIGSLPTAAALSNRAERRISATPKPFLRPFPVRPQSQNADGSVVVPRRFSSLSPAGPAPIPLGIVVNRSVTAPTRPPSAAANVTSQAQAGSLQTAAPGQQLRRPTSVQIRSDPAPFLSSSRPVRAISSTPSFVPGKRASIVPTSNLHQAPSIPVLRGQGQQLTPPKTVTPRRSMPVMGLPPPAPPPNMPLPPPPPVGPPRTVAV